MHFRRDSELKLIWIDWWLGPLFDVVRRHAINSECSVLFCLLSDGNTATSSASRKMRDGMRAISSQDYRSLYCTVVTARCWEWMRVWTCVNCETLCSHVNRYVMPPLCVDCVNEWTIGTQISAHNMCELFTISLKQKNLNKALLTSFSKYIMCIQLHALNTYIFCTYLSYNRHYLKNTFCVIFKCNKLKSTEDQSSL